MRRPVWVWAFALSCAGIVACGDGSVGGTEPTPPSITPTCEPKCSGEATCVVSGSLASCQCASGYVYDANTGCQNVNECTDGTAQCAQPYVCSDTEGSYDCACPAGLEDVNGHCEDPISGLTKVENLQATVDGDTVLLNWDLVDGASSYQIFESVSEGTTSGELGSDRALIGTVTAGASFLWELPVGELNWARISATPFVGEDVASLRNDGVGLRLDSAPSRSDGANRYFSVLPVSDAAEINLALMADSVSARTVGQNLRCGWQYRTLHGGDPRWQPGTTRELVGLELHETTILGPLEYRCVPEENEAVVTELVEKGELYDELMVAEGRVGTCTDGERATSEFERFTDCGGQCAVECQAPLYVGERGPITVLYGEDETAFDVSWEGLPPVLSVSMKGDSADLFALEDHKNGRATLTVTGFAEALGTHELTIMATSEMTDGAAGSSEQKLTVIVRPRNVEKLAIGSFGCAVIEGGYLKCFGQNPRGILGNGGSKSPGVMIPAHQVRPLKMALRGGANPEYVIDLDVNRDVACALIGEEGGTARRVSCWGGRGGVEPRNLFEDDGDARVISAKDLLHVSTISGADDVFGDGPTEVPGQLTADSAIKDVLSGAEKIILGRPWLCVQDGAGTLNCADGTRLTTIAGVVDVWTEPGGVFSCVTTQTEAWCGAGMPDPAMRIEGKIALPSNTVMPPQRVAMMVPFQAFVVQDASGQVFVGSTLDANGNSYEDGHIEFPILPQLARKPAAELQDFQRMVVSSNAVCDSRDNKAFCWGLGLKRFADQDVVPPGMVSLGEEYPEGYERLVSDVAAVQFVEAENIQGDRWYLNNNSLCSWSSPSDEVHCRQDSAGVSAQGVIAMEYGFNVANTCDRYDFSCTVGALLSTLVLALGSNMLATLDGLNSLRPGWISPTAFKFTHHLVEGPPESFGPVLSKYYVAGRSFYLPRWFADGDGDFVEIKSQLKVGAAPATDYAFDDTCHVSAPVFIDGELMAGCLNVDEPLPARSSIMLTADDGIHQVTETTQTLISLQLPLTRDVAVGAAHVCVLGEPDAGYLTCWGSNSRGQIGKPSLVGENYMAQLFVLTREPVDVQVGNGNRPIVGIAAGRAHTCAVLEATGTAGPEIICSGDNTYGAVTPVPHVFPGCEEWEPCDCVGPDCHINGFYTENTIRLGADVARIIDFQLGADYSCALVATHAGADRLTCWGDLRFFNELLPIAENAPDVSPVPDPSCTKGLVVSGATAGLIHFGPDSFKDPSFPQGALDLELQSLGVGLNHICVGAMQKIATKLTGRVYCAGDNRAGQLGRITDIQLGLCFEAAPAFQFQPYGKDVLVRAGRDFTCATYSVTAGKPELHCWGANDRGQLGRGPGPSAILVSPSVTAVRVPEGNSLIPGTWDQSDFEAEANVYATREIGALTVGLDHACTSTAEGAFYCWGENRGYFAGLYAAYKRDEGLDELIASNEVLQVLGRLGAGWLEPFSPYALFAGHALGPVFKADTYGTTTCVIVGSSEVKCFGPSAAGETGRAGTWGDDELGLNGPGSGY